MCSETHFTWHHITVWFWFCENHARSCRLNTTNNKLILGSEIMCKLPLPDISLNTVYVKALIQVKSAYEPSHLIRPRIIEILPKFFINMLRDFSFFYGVGGLWDLIILYIPCNEKQPSLYKKLLFRTNSHYSIF